jgi:tyrosinase
MYTYYFERIVRAAVAQNGGPAATFALPYWNYDRGYPTNSIPRAFRTKLLRDRSANPLYLADPIRAPLMMAGWVMKPEVTSAAKALADPNFFAPRRRSSFGGAPIGPVHNGDGLGDLESTPHNAVHGTIGGDYQAQCVRGWMSHPNCAAQDPIFWIHHANIDRLWTRWVAIPGHANPTESRWLNERFTFFDENGQTVTKTVADILDTVTQLDYTYDDAPAPIDAALTVSSSIPPSSGPPEIVAATDAPVTLTGRGTVVSLLPADQPIHDALAVDAVPRRVYLNVEDIRADHNPGLSYGVYLATPSAQRHVGNVSLFGLEEMRDPDRQHAAGSGLGHTFDVTDELNDLRAAGSWDPAELRVRLEPLTLDPPPGLEVDAAPTVEHTPITIGRVSLAVG